MRSSAPAPARSRRRAELQLGEARAARRPPGAPDQPAGQRRRGRHARAHRGEPARASGVAHRRGGLRTRQHHPGAGPRLRVLVVNRRAAHPDRGATAPDRGRRVCRAGRCRQPRRAGHARRQPQPHQRGAGQPAPSRSRCGRRSSARRSSGRPRPARFWGSSVARPRSCNRCSTRSHRGPSRASATRTGRLSAGAKPTADIGWQRPAMPTRSSCGTWRRTPSFPGGQP